MKRKIYPDPNDLLVCKKLGSTVKQKDTITVEIVSTDKSSHSSVTSWKFSN